MTKWKGLCLDPLDTLFFRDGKPFGASDKAKTRNLPMPQTAAGAARTWLMEKLGCDFGRLADSTASKDIFDNVMRNVQFRGPWFYLKETGQLLFPVPSTLVEKDGNAGFDLLRPLDAPLPGWDPPKSGMKPLWRKDPAPAKRVAEPFITMAGMKKFLAGKTPSRDDLLSADMVYTHDRRTGIGVDKKTLTAEEGQIYAVNLLVLKKGVSLYLEIDAPDDIAKTLPQKEKPAAIKLGGESRYASFFRTETSLLSFADIAISPAQGQGAMLVLLTPALFGGWKPPSLDGSLVSAAVPGYEAVSGWDLAKRGPKPNRFAVSAGAVYFVDKPPDAAVGSLCEGKDARIGYGIYAMGRFDYA